MNIKQALDYGAKILAETIHELSLRTARLDAEVILSFVLKKPREFLYTYPEMELDPSTSLRTGSKCVQSFDKLIKKRTQYYPIAYITNNKEFFGLNFYVDERVLIPRPETELLVENVVGTIHELSLQKMIIAEIGTGSGCIAISLAKNCNCKIIATDISKKALQVAKKNAKTHKVLSKIQFLRGDLLEPIKNKKINILVANLPYLTNNYSGLKYEPQLALKAGARGLVLYKKLFSQIVARKNKPKQVYIEIAHEQAHALTQIIKKFFPVETHCSASLQIIKDLANLNRIIRITF